MKEKIDWQDIMAWDYSSLQLSKTPPHQRHPSGGWDPGRKKLLEEVICLLGSVRGFIVNWIPASAGMTPWWEWRGILLNLC